MPKKKKEKEVLISLEDNQKRKVNKNDVDYDSFGDLKYKRKKKKDSVEDKQKIFLCNLSFKEYASRPPYGPSCKYYNVLGRYC